MRSVVDTILTRLSAATTNNIIGSKSPVNLSSPCRLVWRCSYPDAWPSLIGGVTGWAATGLWARPRRFTVVDGDIGDGIVEDASSSSLSKDGKSAGNTPPRPNVAYNSGYGPGGNKAPSSPIKRDSGLTFFYPLVPKASQGPAAPWHRLPPALFSSNSSLPTNKIVHGSSSVTSSGPAGVRELWTQSGIAGSPNLNQPVMLNTRRPPARLPSMRERDAINSHTGIREGTNHSFQSQDLYHRQVKTECKNEPSLFLQLPVIIPKWGLLENRPYAELVESLFFLPATLISIFNHAA
ncbi:unnamed protein product [Protopolystoma xenopodis]|uniref:Uncharacterized protein n=1 Tax=Protopolystoma xenopodis TaxID=117903 RepID=A0A448XNS6_9PLAT|nr:unnamed protein product [Protopolystoma xenopodis]